MPVPTTDETRAQFLAARRKGIGGSDAAAIVLGSDGYRTASDVWLDKTGLLKASVAGTKATDRGNWLEAPILDRYVARMASWTGSFARPARVFDALDPLAAPGTPTWMRASPDLLGLSLAGEVAFGCDAKSCFGAATREYGEEGTDAVPEYVLLQCMHYIAFFGVLYWDVEAFCGDNLRGEFRSYRIHRDDELVAVLLDAERVFWTQHVLPGVPPQPNDVASATRLVKALYPGSLAPMRSIARSSAAARDLERLRDAEEAFCAAGEDLESARNRAKELIGDAVGCDVDGVGKVTWMSRRDGARTFRTKWI